MNNRKNHENLHYFKCEKKLASASTIDGGTLQCDWANIEYDTSKFEVKICFFFRSQSAFSAICDFFPTWTVPVYTISNHPLKRHQRSLHKVKKSSNLNNNFLCGLLRSLFLFILCILFVRRFVSCFFSSFAVTWLYYAVCAGCVCPLKQLMLTCIVDDVAIVDALSIHHFCDRVFYCCRRHRYCCCCCYFYHCNG